jgi:hypothetical protein
MVNKRDGRTSRKSRKAARHQSPQSDNGTPPSLSEVLEMDRYPNLQIVDSDGSARETIEEGDW